MSKNKENASEKEMKKTIKPDSNANVGKKDDKKGGWKKLSEKNLAVVITALILSAFMIGTSAFFLVDAIINDGFFSYMRSNMSKYVELDESMYKGFDLIVDIASPKEEEVDTAILMLLAQDKGNALNDGNFVTSAFVVTPGTELKIWYRGYLEDENGKIIEVPGMSNMSSQEPYILELGMHQSVFGTGFETGIWGINTGDYPKFVKITDEKTDITESHIAYISFSRLPEGGDAMKDTTKASGVRIDLSSGEVDKNFGEGFKEKLLGATIGKNIGETVEDKTSFEVTLNGKKYTYSDTKVNFVTTCENDENNTPLTVTTCFPYNYSTTTLRNETAKFEVYIDGGIQYEEQKFDEDYVKELVSREGSKITLAELQNYSGEKLTDKYKSYVKEAIDKLYSEEYDKLVSEAFWKHVLSKAEVKKYPKSQVEKVYNEYVKDVEYQFEESGGYLQNEYTGESETYSNINEYACAYLGIGSATDWRHYLKGMSESLVKERLVLYYILSVEDLKPTKKELKKMVADEKQIYLDEYVRQYLEYEKKKREDFTDKEYEDYVDARAVEIFSYYSDEHFEETALYNLAMKEVVKWPNVITFDDGRRAYPVDK